MNDQISDRVNQAILHAMELQPDNRPETVEDWLKELGWRTKFTFPSLGNKRLQVLLAAILASGELATKYVITASYALRNSYNGDRICYFCECNS